MGGLIIVDDIPPFPCAPASGSRLVFQDIVSGLSLDAWRAYPGACREDMGSCELPRMP